MNYLRQYKFSTFKWCTQFLENIEQNASRKAKITIFEQALKEASQHNLSEELVQFALCLTNQTAEQKDIGIPEITLYKSISNTFNINYDLVSRVYGDVTEIENFEVTYLKHRPEASVPFSIIHNRLVELFNVTGNGSEVIKEELISDLLALCSSPQEVKYLVRFLNRSMRIGLSTKSVSGLLDEKTKQKLLGYQSGNSDIIVGVPILPQLAKSNKTSFDSVENKLNTQEILKDFVKKKDCECFYEYKYDGERLQVHYQDGKINLYGRSLDEKTNQFDALAFQLIKYFDSHRINNIILDCEMICYKNGMILPFQEMQNKTNQNSEFLSLVCFDVLYYDNKSLLNETYSNRQKVYQSLLKPITKQRLVISHIQSYKFQTEQQIEEFYMQSLKEGLEGIMIKRDVSYAPGQRTDWLKIKKEKDADLAVLGAYYGKGKRSKWLGAFLLGVYDQNKNKLLPIAKIGTGFSDAQLQVFTERYLPLTLSKPPLNVEIMKPEPHIWLPVQDVWEVTYDVLSSSPTYPIKNNKFEGGLSVRFPRFKRERPDKKYNQCMTVDEMVDEYLKQ